MKGEIYSHLHQREKRGSVDFDKVVNGAHSDDDAAEIFLHKETREGA